jgi:hypothetical protein
MNVLGGISQITLWAGESTPRAAQYIATGLGSPNPSSPSSHRFVPAAPHHIHILFFKT